MRRHEKKDRPATALCPRLTDPEIPNTQSARHDSLHVDLRAAKSGWNFTRRKMGTYVLPRVRQGRGDHGCGVVSQTSHAMTTSGLSNDKMYGNTTLSETLASQTTTSSRINGVVWFFLAKQFPRSSSEFLNTSETNGKNDIMHIPDGLAVWLNNHHLHEPLCHTAKLASREKLTYDTDSCPSPSKVSRRRDLTQCVVGPRKAGTQWAEPCHRV